MNVRLKSGALRRVVLSGYVGIFLSVMAIVGVLRLREVRQRVHVAALLRFHASVAAQYGAYEYHPTPTSRLASTYGDIVIVYPGGQRTMGFYVTDEPPRLLGWLLPILGEHSLVQITGIAISDETFSDDDVDLLLAFPDVREVDVSRTALSDEGLSKLTRLKRLVVLDISETAVSGAALQKLSTSKELKELTIDGIVADDEAVTFLKKKLPGCWIRP